MTRRGKIARLPRAVRDELNQRIEDGETGARLVEWLNGRDEVQGVLKTCLGGRAITEQNLSDWRAGGYADWQESQATFELANGIMEEAADRKGLVTKGRLADHVGDMAALSLARMLRAMRRMEDGPEQWETTLKIVREVVRLRASDRAYEEAQRRQETHDRYEGEAWQRARAGFENAEEKLDQLIMRKLVRAGRGKPEDISAPTRSTRARARRVDLPASEPMGGRAELMDEMDWPEDEGPSCSGYDVQGENFATPDARRESRSACRAPCALGTASGGTGCEDQSAFHFARDAKPTAGGQRTECGAMAGGQTYHLGGEPGTFASPAPQSAQADKPTEAGKPVAVLETTGAHLCQDFGGQAPQAVAVPQGSSGLIKVKRRSRKGSWPLGWWTGERWAVSR